MDKSTLAMLFYLNGLPYLLYMCNVYTKKSEILTWRRIILTFFWIFDKIIIKLIIGRERVNTWVKAEISITSKGKFRVCTIDWNGREFIAFIYKNM